MKANLLDRYFVTREGLVYDCLDNDKRQITRIRPKDRHKTVYVWAEGKAKTERCVSRLVAQIYLPNPDNHYHVYVKEPERVDLETMQWVNLTDLRILRAGGNLKKEAKAVKVNGGYPKKPAPEPKPSLMTMKWS